MEGVQALQGGHMPRAYWERLLKFLSAANRALGHRGEISFRRTALLAAVEILNSGENLTRPEQQHGDADVVLHAVGGGAEEDVG
jgi:hypothetical protein